MTARDNRPLPRLPNCSDEPYLRFLARLDAEATHVYTQVGLKVNFDPTQLPEELFVRRAALKSALAHALLSCAAEWPAFASDLQVEAAYDFNYAAGSAREAGSLPHFEQNLSEFSRIVERLLPDSRVPLDDKNWIVDQMHRQCLDLTSNEFASLVPDMHKTDLTDFARSLNCSRYEDG